MNFGSQGAATRMRQAAILAGVAFAVALSFVRPAAAQVADPHVRTITYGGTGCPGGSMSTSVSNDRTSFTLIFDRFVASTGPGVPITESRKNCQLNVNVEATAPATRVLRLDYRGYRNVPSGMSAEAKSTVYPPGGDETSVTASQVSPGPTTTDYLFRHEICIVLDEAGVSPVNINAQVRLLGSSAQVAQATMDSIDGYLLDEPCTVAPTITVASPVEGGLYGRGSVVVPDVTCTANSGPIPCESVPALLDTSTSGEHSFTVTATDDLGNETSATVTYRVGSKDDCKHGGWATFVAPAYTNQGQCVSDSVKH